MHTHVPTTPPLPSLPPLPPQVRHYAKAELSGFIRISVGKPHHTDAVLAALKAM